MTARIKSRAHADSAQGVLRRLLEEPRLVRTVQNLEPRALAHVVRQVGLEDAGELVAMATSEQLERVLEEDLWSSHAPGADEDFDGQRFALWLEVMLEAGDEAAAHKVAELSEDLVALGLCNHVLVIDLDAWALQVSDNEQDNDQLEKALDSCLYCEIDEYRVISRGTNGWDAIVTVLLALDRAHHEVLARVLELCCAATTEYIEGNGDLHSVLTSAEVLDADVSARRDDRRAFEGFVAPADARAFLALTRGTELSALMGSDEVDPVTGAYLRELGPAATQPSRHTPSRAARSAEKRVLALLGEAQGAEARHAEPKRAHHGSPSEQRFSAAMRVLSDTQPAVQRRLMDELAYLANVLLSGATDRKLRPVEAAQRAAWLCAEGLSLLATQTAAVAADAAEVDAQALSRHGLVKLFRVAYRAHGDTPASARAT